MLIRRSILLLVVALSLSAFAFADPMTVSMTFLYPGSNNMGGFYTYPYYFSINGGQPTAMMCDAFNNRITQGESWTANVTGLLAGKGMLARTFSTTRLPG